MSGPAIGYFAAVRAQLGSSRELRQYVETVAVSTSALITKLVDLYHLTLDSSQATLSLPR